MITRRVVGSLALLVAATTGAARAADPASVPPAVLDPTADRIVARTVVPSAARRVGEVRLVARGDAIVVQTLLASKVLSRVVGEIRKKEEANWPAGTPGAEGRAAYVTALEAARADVAAHAPDTPDFDRRLRLLIEFVATGTLTAVHFAGFAGDERDGVLQPRERRAIATLALPRGYAVRNMRLILADAFALPEPEVERLGPLGPLTEGVATPPAPR